MKKPCFNILKNGGFTFVELLISIAISSFIVAAVYMTYRSQQKSYIDQEQVAAMQQNLRSGIGLMQREIRMAGYDPQGTPGFSIIDICPRNKDNSVDISISGNGAISFTFDLNENGTLDGNETISYSICDSPISSPNGILDLSRNNGAGRQLLAEGIEAMGLAYAFDANGDSQIDTYQAVNMPNPPAPAPPLTAEDKRRVIWAIDSDGDNDLDRNLDTQLDGDIDADDGPGAGGNGLIPGQPLIDFDGNPIPDVSPDDIRAVRIWMLARSLRDDSNFVNNFTYTVGHKVISPASDSDTTNDGCRMRLLTTTVNCRNMGL